MPYSLPILIPDAIKYGALSSTIKEEDKQVTSFEDLESKNIEEILKEIKKASFDEDGEFTVVKNKFFTPVWKQYSYADLSFYGSYAVLGLI